MYFIDPEKGFDRVEWVCLKKVLTKIGLDHVFLSCKQLIYSAQVAEIYSEKCKFHSIFFSRGVLQRCPLSPLLFNIVIESLAMAVWANLNIRSIEISDPTHKLALYADDACFLL